MIIKYIGHACFKVRDNQTGYSIVFDPYTPDSIPGFRSIVDTASEVLCSHEHFDHNHRESLKLEPSDNSPFEISFIDTWHDPQKGALRGPNRIHIVKDKMRAMISFYVVFQSVFENHLQMCIICDIISKVVNWEHTL